MIRDEENRLSYKHSTLSLMYSAKKNLMLGEVDLSDCLS